MTVIRIDTEVETVLRALDPDGTWDARTRAAVELDSLERDLRERGLGPTRFARLLELRDRKNLGLRRCGYPG